MKINLSCFKYSVCIWVLKMNELYIILGMLTWLCGMAPFNFVRFHTISCIVTVLSGTGSILLWIIHVLAVLVC
jgi:hypothetical protein